MFYPYNQAHFVCLTGTRFCNIARQNDRDGKCSTDGPLNKMMLNSPGVFIA